MRKRTSSNRILRFLAITDGAPGDPVACYSRPLSPAIRRQFRRRLLDWFAGAKRDLPWRRTGDPYRIWLSEIMLQQTRVAAAEPYYHRFLDAFPSIKELAAADEQQVLTLWAGLGYYSRARNLHKAAREVAAKGAFPAAYDEIRALPGVGDYTAAAVASIAFGLPHASVDGNVLRVLARVSCESGDIGASATRNRLAVLAQELLDPARPGDFNQAMMELGATVCLPRQPLCGSCPVTPWCQARQTLRQNELPVKLRARRRLEIEENLLIIVQGDSILLWQRPAESGRMAGFWELPEASQLPQAKLGRELGVVRHTITFHSYTFRVHDASIRRAPPGLQWINRNALASVPVSTVLRKALRLV
jgi:A/G-specific adenine glycosylase